MHTSASVLVIYTFAILTPLVQIVDTIIQWRMVQRKYWGYVFGRVTYLIIALASIIVLIVYTHSKMTDGPEAAWTPALVALCGLSILLGISMQAIVAWRMFDKLTMYGMLRRLVRINIGYATFMVLSLNLLFFAFATKETYGDYAPITVAIGSFWAHIFLCCIVLSFDWQNLFKPSYQGLLCCCLLNFLGAVAVLSLLPLSHTDWFLPGQLIVAWTLQIPWIFLQAYKLPRNSPFSPTTYGRGDNNVLPSDQRGVSSYETNRTDQELVPTQEDRQVHASSLM